MKWDKRSKLLKISTYAIIICLILGIVIAGFTIYGNKVGNFVVSVDNKKNVNIALSVKEDRSEETARLAARGAENQVLATLKDIPKDLAKNGMGNKTDNVNAPHYMAYTFYLINHSDKTIDYTIDIDIIEVTQRVDHAVRVMILEEDDSRGPVYAMPRDSDGLPEDHTNLGQGDNSDEPYTTVPFLSQSKVLQTKVTNFAPEAYVKYTIVLWLEGWDDDANDDIQGGTIRMSMRFTGE